MAIRIGGATGDYDESDTWNNPDHTISSSNEQIVVFCYDNAKPSSCYYDSDALTKIIDVGSYMSVWGSLKHFTVASGLVDFSGHSGPGVEGSIVLTGLRDLTTYSSGQEASGSASAFSLTVNGAAGWLALVGCTSIQQESAYEPQLDYLTVGGVSAYLYGWKSVNNFWSIGYALMTGPTIQFDYGIGHNHLYYASGVALPPKVGGGYGQIIG